MQNGRTQRMLPRFAVAPIWGEIKRVGRLVEERGNRLFLRISYLFLSVLQRGGLFTRRIVLAAARQFSKSNYFGKKRRRQGSAKTLKSG